MKPHWDENKGTVTDWLPPVMEWDFRMITAREARLACCWEYARSVSPICDNLTGWLEGAGGLTTLGNFICTKGTRFPAPWSMAWDELAPGAELFEEAESPITVYSFRERKALLMAAVAEAQREGWDAREAVERLIPDGGYGMHIEFGRWGIVALGQYLMKWLRLESRNHPGVRRGKGATPPFEWLKWLAALRLESARNDVGASYEEVQATLREHQRRFPIANASPTLPVYSGHGAWSKAISDARRALGLLESDPLKFEKRILLFRL